LYHFRAVATNAVGTSNGADMTFTTTACPPQAPTVTTQAASGIGQTAATLNGTVNPNGGATDAYFEYGTTTSYGSTTTPSSMGSGSSVLPFSDSVGSLTCNTLYHFRAVATNAGGTSNGADMTFTTTACPLYSDDFEDATLDPNWLYERGDWDESGGSLNGQPDNGIKFKARAFADPAFAGCSLCTFEAVMEAHNPTGTVATTSLKFFGWFESKQTNVQVILKPLGDKVIFKQKENKVLLTKTTAVVPLATNVSYLVQILFDGTTFRVFLDGVEIINAQNQASTTPSGTLGFQSRDTDISVHSAEVR
jgi:hypothetical protein